MTHIDTIYIIDDNDVYQLVMKTIINKINPSVKILSYLNGEDGINALKNLIKDKESMPDVILLDINMPIMNGWEFMNEFSKIHTQLSRTIPIYLTTSSPDDSDIEKAKAYEHITGVLSKPIDRHILMKLIQGKK